MDFELLKSGEIIGYDGDEEIKTVKESIIIFAHEMTIKEKGKEAFYIGYKV